MSARGSRTDRGNRAGPPPVEQRAVVASPKAAYASIEHVIVNRQQDIVATLAQGIDPTQFLKVALQAITRTPKLLECTPTSFVLALRDAAEMGLMPSGLLGEGYLVPYRNHGVMEAQFQAGYLGLVKLARQSGEVLDVESRVVRERDFLDIAYGSGGHVVHRPWITGRDGEEDPGARQGAWFRAVLRDSADHIGWMSVAEIEAVRRRSKAADTGPWVTDWEAMARKTVTRAELKWLPRSTALTRAMENDDIIEGRAEVVAETLAVSGAQQRLLARGGITVTPSDEAVVPEPAQNDSGAAQDAQVEEATVGDAGGQEQAEPASVGRCGAMHAATGLGPCVNEAGHLEFGAPHTDASGVDWS